MNTARPIPADPDATVDNLVEAAFDYPPQQQRLFLENRCRNQPKILAQCLALLGLDEVDSVLCSNLDVEYAHETRGGIAALTDRYQLGGVVARGGSSKVYYARCRATNQPVALKLLKAGPAHVSWRQHFLREQNLLARLDHPNVVRFHDAGQLPGGQLYVATEFIAGDSLLHHCDRHQLDLLQRLRLFRKLCAAVGDLHQQRLIHLDLKPDNILVTPEGRIKLIDFGLAQLNPYHSDWIHGQPSMLTCEYAAPELLGGEGFNHQSDIYALGVVLYELLCGIHPFEGVSTYDLVHKRREQAVLAPSTSLKLLRINEKGRARLRGLTKARRMQGIPVGEWIAPDLDAVVLRAMHPNHEERFSDTKQLSQAVLRHLLGFTTPKRGNRLWQRTLAWLRRFDLVA
ncbi:serine/threonine protein kinase [Acanthopleuribacter pedis]|uniref:Serine/threonine protein kinase n=1 Tax=Acanthopleuribacter pedis TaxID=442870 RepID=A0A8J7U0M6_9BACT|nr:serine/threonine-protein kinase [Acanthopleuribacter pedis]MBO1317238.1 serine/threonine protein kinase [Acanthopleuribacter pedis]MBO1318544.1 serine/threonine protein kinase [Acanthopleuribacter pedis]